MVWILILIMLLYIITSKTNIQEIKNYNEIYKAKRYITTLNELKFYKVLMEIAKELNLVVFSQVSLYAILETRQITNKKMQKYYFEQIKAKSIDFVLVDPENCRIKLCIELDDSTHNRPDRIKRDKFIDKLFKDLEINLYRIPVYQVYYKNTIKQQIVAEMKEHYYVD